MTPQQQQFVDLLKVTMVLHHRVHLEPSWRAAAHRRVRDVQIVDWSVRLLQALRAPELLRAGLSWHHEKAVAQGITNLMMYVAPSNTTSDNMLHDVEDENRRLFLMRALPASSFSRLPRGRDLPRSAFLLPLDHQKNTRRLYPLYFLSAEEYEKTVGRPQRVPPHDRYSPWAFFDNRRASRSSRPLAKFSYMCGRIMNDYRSERSPLWNKLAPSKHQTIEMTAQVADVAASLLRVYPNSNILQILSNGDPLP
jgi:hypothetical protein